MKLHPQIQKEYERISLILSTTKNQDTMDAAVATALSSEDLNNVLGAILDEGACLTGVTMDAAGSIEGIAIFTFNTEWIPGQSRITNPDVACALIEVNPPKVIKVVRQIPGSLPEAGFFTKPEGQIPAIMRNMHYPGSSEALEFNRQANESLENWLIAQRIGGIHTKAHIGLTTGTRCTSLLCFERTSDDWDWQ